MDFHLWMLLPLIPAAVIAFFAFKVWRIRRRGRAFLDLTRAERLRFARLLIRDGSLPLLPRLLVSGAIGYLALPIDLIPDFVPLIGHADDFLVVTVLLAVITRTVPAERMDALLLQARERDPNVDPRLLIRPT